MSNNLLARFSKILKIELQREISVSRDAIGEEKNVMKLTKRRFSAEKSLLHSKGTLLYNVELTFDGSFCATLQLIHVIYE